MSEPSVRGSAGQTFLVGDTIYLRGLEAADAKEALAWRRSPFPIPSSRAARVLKEEIPKAAERGVATLVACRIVDDVPVGAVRIDQSERVAVDLALHAAPALGDAGAEVRTEILRTVLGWLTVERTPALIRVDLAADEPAVAAAEASGMRSVVRLRQALWLGGRRRDLLIHEWPNPAWVGRLGHHAPGIEARAWSGSAPIAPAAPAHPAAVDTGRAMAAGPLLLLRAREAEDAEPMARAFREETETFFGSGRMPWSPLVFADFFDKLGESEPPTDVEFTIALRDGGTMIGENGLYAIDWVHRTAETGSYLYRSEHRGAGFGTEAKHLLLGYAFDALGLHAVRSFVRDSNTRSAAALRKQGYRDAGRLRWIDLRAGAWVEAVVFDLLAEEWRAARRRAARGDDG